ncbi:MAG: dihydrofolate reductase [Bauldia sp.]
MTVPKLALVAAVARNGVIGVGQGMPWRLSTDMRRFRALTMGKAVIMGRRTFQSIGKPLAGRRNIVVTRAGGLFPEGVDLASSLDAAVALAGTDAAEIMVIGGGEIYAGAIGRADRLYITHVEATPEGDTHFPPIDPAVWEATSSERAPAGEKDTAATEFVIYERRRAD